MTGNFADNGDFHAIVGSFKCRKSVTWDRRFYFPSEGVSASHCHHQGIVVSSEAAQAISVLWM
jgi:hypothetical protein